MDILYYSNYCKHSQKIIQTLVKNNLKDKISFICIDNRKRDPDNNQIYIHLENGTRANMPPNLHSVPALLQISKNYQVIYGDDIISQFHNQMKQYGTAAANNGGEPLGYLLPSSAGGTNIMSEKFTDYNMSADELSAKSNSKTRNMYNYVSANESTVFINTPPDDYKPDKVSDDVTLDTLQQQRIDELGLNKPNPQFTGQI